MTTLIARDLRKNLSVENELILTEAKLTYGHQAKVIASGSVKINAKVKGGFTYNMQATSFDLTATNLSSKLIKNNLYNPKIWPRIDGVDDEGRSWSITQLKPAYNIQNEAKSPTIEVIGTTHSISGLQHTESKSVSRHEAIFDFSNYSETADTIGYMVGSLKTIDVDGTTIWFYFDFETDRLHVTALYSESCPQPYLDSWIFEPFQVLFGLPLEPEIVVRVPKNKSRKTQLHLRPTQNFGEELSTGLWTFASSPSDRNMFWDWYQRLFAYFSSHRADGENMSFDCLSLTRYYYELQIASQKTIWLRSLAYAATVEGLAKHLIPEKKRELSKDDTHAIKRIKKYLKKYNRDDVSENQKKIDIRLIDRLHGSLAHLTNMSARNRLLNLVEQNVLRPEHEQSWSNVRNPIMHGNLTKQWSTEEGDSDTRILMEAVARMTCKLVGIECASLRSFEFQQRTKLAE